MVQIKFTGKALYRDLNRAVRRRKIRVKRHRWGERGINVYNILAMVGAMPKTEFQYVKMLSVERLNEYLKHFEPAFKQKEVESVANWILKVKL